jgi:hypothetical protein
MYFFLSTLPGLPGTGNSCCFLSIQLFFLSCEIYFADNYDNYATTLTLLRTILCLDQISRASTFDRAVFFVLAGLGHVLTIR